MTGVELASGVAGVGAAYTAASGLAYAVSESMIWFVLCIFFEARGEPFEGKVAVGHVVMTRVERRDASVKDIVQAPWQFSWFNTNQRKNVAFEDFGALPECFLAAMTVLGERLEGKDFFGADHFHANYVSPKWKDDYYYVGKRGNHLFYDSSRPATEPVRIASNVTKKKNK